MKIAVNDGKRQVLQYLLNKFASSRPHGTPSQYHTETEDHGLLEEGGVVFYIQRIFTTPYAFRSDKSPRFEINGNGWSLTLQLKLPYGYWNTVPESVEMIDLRLTGELDDFHRDLMFVKMFMSDATDGV